MNPYAIDLGKTYQVPHTQLIKANPNTHTHTKIDIHIRIGPECNREFTLSFAAFRSGGLSGGPWDNQ